MCYINSASLEPCDCFGDCEFCGEPMDDDNSNETPKIGTSSWTICDDCYEAGVDCEGCGEVKVSWEHAAYTNAAYGCPLCEGCEKESER